MIICILKEVLKFQRNAKPVNYSIDPQTGCWNVISHAPNGLNGKGYPLVQRNGQRVKAHRYSYELACSPIPDGLFVLHHCDNRICINPAHLFLGTHVDNRQDAMRKGRLPHFYGEANGSSKLTKVDVRAIRADKILTQIKLGEKYGVSGQQVSRIKNGENWKHILVSEGDK